MSFRRLVVCLSFLAVFTMAVRVAVDTDTWWHLRAGRWMVENGQFLRTDPFSLTRQGEPWIYPGWLAQVILYGVFHTLGFAGLNLLTAMMVVIAFAFIWPLLDAPSLLRAFVLILAATVSGVYWSARPQIFSFAFTAIFLWSLTKAKSGERGKLWILPPLMAIWSNLHGGFAIGFMLIGVYLLGELIEFVLIERHRRKSFPEVMRDHKGWIRTLLMISLACVIAVGLNPHGFHMLVYPFKTVSVGVLQDYIEEWQSPNFHRLEVQPFLWMLMLTLVALTISREKKRVVDLLFVVGFASLSLFAARNIATFALVAAPVFAQHSYAAIEPLVKRWTPGPNLRERIARVINLVLLAFLILAALIKISLPLSDPINQEAVAKQVPVDAVALLHEHPNLGPLYNSYNWGGYVIWALYPDYLSFVDGRTDLFGDEILEGYLAAWRAEPGWQHFLDQWGIKVALVEPHAPLAYALEQAGWEVLYIDEQAIIYVKD